MKKTLALLMALVMCLSLCACGEKKQTVEITMDNWMDFFEVRKEIEWEENDFGEAECLQVYHALFIRDEYAESINPDSIKLVFEYCEEGALKTFDVDWENKILTEGELAESSNTKVHTATYNTANGVSYYEQQPLLVHRFDTGTNMGLVGKDEYINKGLAEKDMADRFGYFFTNWQILRIEGTIEVKGELLDLPNTTQATNIIETPQPVVMETIIPETTVTPEPVYETIEITADNLWDYFEITEEVRYHEDDFGDLTGIRLDWHFKLKPEFTGKLQLENTDFAVELEHDFLECGVNLDWENRTYELMPQTSERLTFTVGIKNDYDGMIFSNGYGQWINGRDIKRNTTITNAIPTDTSSYTVLRIKGHITLLREG